MAPPRRSASAFLAAALLAAAFSLWLCLQAPEWEPRLLPEAEEPVTVAAVFFNSLCQGDDGGAAACLPKGTQLGLDQAPEEETLRRVYAAFRESWRWTTAGACVRTGDRAVLPVAFTCLSPAALTEGLDREVSAVLEGMVEAAGRREDIYGPDDRYREEVVLEAVDSVLSARLETPESYLDTVYLDLRLRYENGRWYVQPDEALWQALSGAAG